MISIAREAKRMAPVSEVIRSRWSVDWPRSAWRKTTGAAPVCATCNATSLCNCSRMRYEVYS